MKPKNIRGKAHVFGDNIDTDRILAGRYTKTEDEASLGKHVFEDLDPAFLERFHPGDLIVAGVNFGCGSSREQAPLAMQAAGVSAVVAHSFARIFFRNAINIGLPIAEIGAHDILDGNQVQVDLSAGEVHNLDSGAKYSIEKLPEIMVEILNAGGLINYMKLAGNFEMNDE